MYTPKHFEELRVDVEAHHLAPAVVRVVLRGRGPDRAGVVDQDVEAAEILEDPVDEVLGVRVQVDELQPHSWHGVIGRVRKTRWLLMCGATRIHLDEVEGLGAFLELEVVLEDSSGRTVSRVSTNSR